MAEDLDLKSEAEAAKAGLSPFNCLMTPGLTILSVIEQLASEVDLKPQRTDSEGWRAVARYTGTHTLKLADPKIGSKNTDVWIFDPDPGYALTARALRTYAYDGKYSRLAKVLLVPFVRAGANEPLTLIDVLPENSSPHSPEARQAFSRFFGADALAGLDRGLAERATASMVKCAASLKARTVYVPDGVGNYFLITPVMATDAYVALTRVRERMKDRAARIRLHRTKLSGKAQNVASTRGAANRLRAYRRPMLAPGSMPPSTTGTILPMALPVSCSGRSAFRRHSPRCTEKPAPAGSFSTSPTR